MKIHDISMTISNDMLTYPGDPGVEIKKVKEYKKDGVNLSDLRFGAHTGTHIDAPCHFTGGGSGIDKIDPSKLIGPCRVIDLSPQNPDTPLKKSVSDERKADKNRGNISLADLKGLKIKKGERLLFKTANSKIIAKKIFNKDFIAISPEASEYLVKKQVALLGIDYLSIEPYKTPGHPTHKNLLKARIAVIEGLDLRGVSEGNYFLVALPLKIKGSDGGPARVMLIEGLK